MQYPHYGRLSLSEHIQHKSNIIQKRFSLRYKMEKQSTIYFYYKKLTHLQRPLKDHSNFITRTNIEHVPTCLLKKKHKSRHLVLTFIRSEIRVQLK